MNSEPKVVMTIEMTPEQYVAIKKDALWHSGGDVGKYLVNYATGNIGRGC